MPEPKVASEVLRAGTPVTVGSVTLLPIERVVTHTSQGSTSVWFSVSKDPVALVVRDAYGIRAIETDTAGVSLEHLRAEIPELDAVLASM
jgi:hypothetical protein